MGTTHQNRPRRRPGFTLIELLVVMSIIVFLAGILILLGPTLLRSEQASRGAQTLQGDLFIAKQQALRDRNPYGIRLLRESTVSTDPNYNVVRSFRYIQQPNDFIGGRVSINSGSTTALFTGVDLWGGFDASDPSLWPVQPGDYLQISTDFYHKIAGVASTGLSGGTLTLANGYAGGTY